MGNVARELWNLRATQRSQKSILQPHLGDTSPSPTNKDSNSFSADTVDLPSASNSSSLRHATQVRLALLRTFTRFGGLGGCQGFASAFLAVVSDLFPTLYLFHAFTDSTVSVCLIGAFFGVCCPPSPVPLSPFHPFPPSPPLLGAGLGGGTWSFFFSLQLRSSDVEVGQHALSFALFFSSSLGRLPCFPSLLLPLPALFPFSRSITCLKPIANRYDEKQQLTEEWNSALYMDLTSGSCLVSWFCQSHALLVWLSSGPFSPFPPISCNGPEHPRHLLKGAHAGHTTTMS